MRDRNLRRPPLVRDDFSYPFNHVSKPVKIILSSKNRRKYLLQLLQTSLYSQNSHPFENVKLNRSDIIFLYKKRQKGNYATESNSPQILNLHGADLRLRPQLNKQKILKPINLSRLDLKKVIFTAAKLEKVNFEGANLRGANFTGASLKNAIFSQAELTGVKFSNAALDNAFFERAKVTASSFVDFSGASLIDADLKNVEFHEAKFINSKMKNSILFKAKIQKVNFNGADLTNANLRYAEFNEADFSSASGTAPAILTKADLFEAKILTKADFTGADLKETQLVKVVFNDTTFNNANLTGANLTGANLTGAAFTEATLTAADLTEATLVDSNFTQATLIKANLTGTSFIKAKFGKADLTEATFTNANFTQAQFIEATLTRANLAGANFTSADLYGAKLHDALLFRTNLENADITEVEMADDSNTGPSLHNVIWNNANLTVVNWSKVKKLKEGKTAEQKKDTQDNKKPHKDRAQEYFVAAQAYNQLAVSLRNQGLKEATHFDYQSKRMYQKNLWHSSFTKEKESWAKTRSLGSWLLDVFCGYGYKFRWAAFWYILIILIFFTIFWLSTYSKQVSWVQALVTSINAFHGRALSAPAMDDIFKNSDWLLLVAGVEGILGLIMEVTLIATLTQRLFGK